MTYKALYRTYRPQKFSEVVGQEHIVRTLQNSILNNKISHAYLFSGPRGTGKTSVARIFAKTLNCENQENVEPCGVCLSCIEIAQSNSPDVVEIDAASNNGVDEIREIRDKVKFLPAGSKYKIYIIDEVHMLSQGAFNALLKTLEEPPKHVIFILATTEPHKVIPTILSRCQRFDFKTLSVQEIANVVRNVSKEEGFKISEEAIIGISEGAEGGMRDALSYLDQAASFTDDEITIDDVNSVTGNLSFDKILELAKHFEDKNLAEGLKIVNDLIIMGKETIKIVSALLQFYRDSLLYKNIDTSAYSKYIFEKDEFKQLIDNISEEKIFYFIDVLSEVQTKIKFSSTPTVYLEVAIIKMVNSSEEDFAYNKRIKQLEDAISSLEHAPVGNNHSSISGDDLEKVSLIEGRLNKVINELSRLELHKLSERIEVMEKQGHAETGSDPRLMSLRENLFELEKKVTNFSSQYNNEIENKIDSLKNELKNFQNQAIREQIMNNPNPELEENVQQLRDIVLNMQGDIYSLRKAPGAIGQNNIQNLQEKLDKKYQEQLEVLEKKLEELKQTSHEPQIVQSSEDLDLELIKDKINNIETKLYKLIAGELDKKESRKTRPKVNRKQIVLFGDELTNLNEFKKFERQEEETEVEEIVEDVEKEELLIEDIQTEDLQTEELQAEVIQEEVKKVEQEQPSIQESQVEEPEAKETVQEEVVFEEEKELEQEQLKVEEEVIDTSHSILKNEYADLNALIEAAQTEEEPEEEEVIVVEEAPVVRPVEVQSGTIDAFLKEKQLEESRMAKAEVAQASKEEQPLKEESPQVQEQQETKPEFSLSDDLANDEYSRYDVKVLERILHASRSEEARADRIRIDHLWQGLNRSVPHTLSNIALLLQDGKLAAVGDQEFILVYPNAALCNQVMKMSFKKDSLKLLYDFLGDMYNYMAIPEDIWNAKRTEYINQYNIGTRFPKLTEIQDPKLNVTKGNQDYIKKQENSKSKAISFFGEDLVNLE